jgi:predicted dehydrogenase
MDKIGIGIIGCGYWGINYLRVFGELDQARMIVACDQRVERQQEVRRRCPDLAVTSTAEELLRRDDVQAVVICTPAAAHFPVARLCLAAGKHVLVEKPMATTTAEAQEMVALAQAHGLVLMVGHTFLFNAGIRIVKDYIDQGSMGRLYYMTARRTNLGPIRHDVNALWDLAPHDVSIFNYLLAETPKWVSAIGIKALQNSHEDVGFVSLGYAGGIVCHVHVSWADPNKVRELIVVGSEKRIVFDDLNTLERVRVFEKGVAPIPSAISSYDEHQFLMRDGDIISPRVENSEPLKNECRHLLDCISQGTQPLSDGQSGLEVVQVMEAIDRSVARGGAPIRVQEIA